MEARELRKGNICTNPMRDIFKTGHVVLEARDIYNLAVHESAQDVDEMYKHFKPIELNESWLYRFGFKKFRNSNDWSKRNFIVHGRKRGFVLNRHVPVIKYVHQLQNLHFANRGTELDPNAERSWDYNLGLLPLDLKDKIFSYLDDNYNIDGDDVFCSFEIKRYHKCNVSALPDEDLEATFGITIPKNTTIFWMWVMERTNKKIHNFNLRYTR